MQFIFFFLTMLQCLLIKQKNAKISLKGILAFTQFFAGYAEVPALTASYLRYPLEMFLAIVNPLVKVEMQGRNLVYLNIGYVVPSL